MKLSTLFPALLFVAAASCNGPDTQSSGVTMIDIQQAIADHAEQESAHHAKTTDASEILTGVFLADRIPAITPSMLSEPAGMQNCKWVVYTNDSGALKYHHFATCPAGKYPVTGGCSGAAGTSITHSQPTANSPIPNDSDAGIATGWYCRIEPAGMNYQAYSLCCDE